MSDKPDKLNLSAMSRVIENKHNVFTEQNNGMNWPTNMYLIASHILNSII